MESIESIEKTSVMSEFFKGLTWVAVFMAISVGVMNITQLLFIDFIHGNPHRSQNNSIFMMAVYTPIFGMIAFFGIFLVFSASHAVQALFAKFLLGRCGRSGLYGLVIIVPFATIITWYCFDYLTPSDVNLGINVGADWVPYKHGITARRYLMTLGAQTSVTAFALLCLGLDVSAHRHARRLLILAVLAVATVAGAIWGYGMASEQFKYL
jgi:hypothetical protein